MSSQPAFPRWLHSVRRATMGSFRTQTSSHTWLCSQLLPYFLQLSAPARVLTSQQRLWKWEIGQQVHSNSGLCALLSKAPLCVPAAFAAQLMTAARWTGGGCGKQQISRTQATGMEADTREVHSFPSSTSLHMSYVATKALQTCTASASVGHRAGKSALHIRSQALMLNPRTEWSNLGAKYKWKWNNSSPLTKSKSLNSYKSHPSSNTFPAFPKHSNSINCLYFRGKCIQ